MNEPLKKTIDLIRAIGSSARIKHSRNFGDFISDRIVQASTEQTLMAAVERLAQLMDVDIGRISSSRSGGFLGACASKDAAAVLAWIRKYPKIAAMLTMLKQTDYAEILDGIELPPAGSEGVAVQDPPHDINLEITCLSPLAHGSDTKAGNATLFRRMQVLSTDGNILSLPYYAGNAIRGQLRDILADHFIESIGLKPRKDNPPVSLWFFHALYAGGALEENSSAEKALRKHLGNTGTVKAQGIYEFRNMLPALSMLGCALGNRVLSGRVRFSDLRPACRQWANGAADVGELFEWTYLTRREDYEDHDENHSMIVNTECLRPGVRLLGGLDLDGFITPIERSALWTGLISLAKVGGYIGAENRRGLGRVSIVFDKVPDVETYLSFLEDHREEIISYLTELGAVDARD